MGELLQNLSTVSFILAVLLLALGATLFFVLDIRGVVGELTGKTATREIARIREEATTRRHKGKTLQSIVLDSDTGSTGFSIERLGLADMSEELTSQPAEGASVSTEDLTTVLSEDTSTEEMTMVLSETTSAEEMTTVLSEDIPAEEMTTVLSEDTPAEDQTVLTDVAATEDMTTVLSGDTSSEDMTTVLSKDTSAE